MKCRHCNRDGYIHKVKVFDSPIDQSNHTIRHIYTCPIHAYDEVVELVNSTPNYYRIMSVEENGSPFGWRNSVHTFKGERIEMIWRYKDEDEGSITARDYPWRISIHGLPIILSVNKGKSKEEIKKVFLEQASRMFDEALESYINYLEIKELK